MNLRGALQVLVHLTGLSTIGGEQCHGLHYQARNDKNVFFEKRFLEAGEFTAIPQKKSTHSRR
jgi:hypothetical protein